MPSASSQANDIGGYTYQFVDPPEDRLQCVICHFMCRDPQLTQCCGHSCCKSCLEEWKRTNSSHACPTCRRRRVKSVAHHEADRTIKDLRVYCSNNSGGCPWTGPLRQVEAHLSSCDTSNIRQCYTSCSACGQDGIWRGDMADHKKVCPRVMVQCPQCGVDVARGDLSTHNNDNIGTHLQQAINRLLPASTPPASVTRCHLIVLTVIITMMVLLGVVVITVMISINNNNMVQVMSSVENNFHTNFTSLDHRYQEDAATTRDQINSIQQTLDINISRQVNVKMDELIKSLQAKVEVDVSSVCELPKYNIKEIRHQLELLKDKVKDKELSQATRLRRLSDEILNQIRLIESKVMSSVPLLNEQCQQDVEEMQHQIEEVLDRLDFIETLNTTRDIDITEHLSEMVEVNSDQSQLLHREPSSDEAYHNMTGSNVSWSQTLHQLSSHDNQIAPVIVKMNNVSEKINNKETWYSEPFFAFKRGYKMCLKIVCSRDKLSVSLYLMKGPYDDDIEPEQSGHLALRGTFTIELLNQLSDVKNVQAKKYYYMRGNISYQNNWLTEFDKSLLTNDYFIHDSVYFRVDCDCVC